VGAARAAADAGACLLRGSRRLVHLQTMICP
jgi:hypothetical protein